MACHRAQNLAYFLEIVIHNLLLNQAISGEGPCFVLEQPYFWEQKKKKKQFEHYVNWFVFWLITYCMNSYTEDMSSLFRLIVIIY